jgi:uncharacterized membrane protein YfcA
MNRGWFDALFGLGLGFYDGFFGPGTGTFWTLAYMVGLGFNMTRATGYTKVMNFASNLSSLAFFLLGGKVLFIAGLVMGAGQLIGARIGARLVVARGTRFIRPVFLTVVSLLAIKLLIAELNRASSAPVSSPGNSGQSSSARVENGLPTPPHGYHWPIGG